MNFGVEVFEELLAGVLHRLVDASRHLLLKALKSRFDFFSRPTALIDAHHSLLEFDSRLNSAKNLIARSKDARKELKLLR